MSSSLVSGPYASAVSIKFTPSSTARLRTLSAFCRSAGQPQMPSPVTRIAPKPSRLTVRSPPKLNVGFVAMFDDIAVSAPRITSCLPARSAAPPARVIPTNLRRLTLRSWLTTAPTSSLIMRRSTIEKTAFNARIRSFYAHQDIKGVFEIFPESDNAGFVTRHDEHLFASHITYLEQTDNFVGHFRRSVSNRL